MYDTIIDNPSTLYIYIKKLFYQLNRITRFNLMLNHDQNYDKQNPSHLQPTLLKIIIFASTPKKQFKKPF